MHEANPGALRAYFARLRPLCPELFAMAYAICGEYAQAEYALQCALADGWIAAQNSRMGFRELMRAAVRRAALANIASGEHTWDALNDAEAGPAMELLSRESTEVRRALVLRYGCGLTAQQTARVLGCGAAEIRRLTARMELRAKKRLNGQDRQLARAIRREMEKPNTDMPGLGSLYRALEHDAAAIRKPRKTALRLAGGVATTLLFLLCCVAFWIVAILLTN